MIASVTKRVIELGLGLGLQLGLGFVNNNFIDIVAWWMKLCCIRIRDFVCRAVYDQSIVEVMTLQMSSKA